eukprot:TRINITY_DN568_c0_g1_i3.p1 TRINITY_DN568_c0_g1~~TRINITY_DN568_c0_g1_i3.p1  ORF type:complete len:333 (-),score=80.48 TRINITY_DN568_c0_g1_i3:93-1091(-)
MSFRAPSIKCVACGKTVYAMEAMKVEDKTFHKSCLKCAECNCVLRLGNYAAVAGKYYCKPHFKQLFKLKGNYSSGFGGDSSESSNQSHSFSIPTGPVNFAKAGANTSSPIRSSGSPQVARAGAPGSPAVGAKPAAGATATASATSTTSTPTPASAPAAESASAGAASTPAPAAKPAAEPASSAPSSAPAAKPAAEPASPAPSSKPAAAASTPSQPTTTSNILNSSNSPFGPRVGAAASSPAASKFSSASSTSSAPAASAAPAAKPAAEPTPAATPSKDADKKEAEKEAPKPAAAAESAPLALTPAENAVCEAFAALLADSNKKALALKKAGL